MHKRTRFMALLLTLFLSVALQSEASWAGPPERLAYVTSEGDNNLVVIDLLAAKPLKTIATGKTPHALAFTPAGKAYVNNRGSRDLTVFDALKLEAIRTIVLSATSFQLAISPDGKLLAVAYKDALKVTFIDTETDEIMTTVPIGKEAAAFKGAMMKHPYWSKDGRFLYASDNVNHTIVKIDADSFSVAATIRLPGSNHYLHPTPDGKRLYAVNETTPDGTSVTVIDSTTDEIVRDIVIPLPIEEKALGHHGEFSPDGRYFFFCNEGGRTLAVLDTARLETVKTIKVGMGAGHPSLSRDGKQLFIVHHGDNIVTVVDTGRQEPIKDIAVGEGRKQAHGSYFSPDGKYFYLLNAEDGFLVAVDTAKQEVALKIPVGKSSMYFGIREGNEYPSVE